MAHPKLSAPVNRIAGTAGLTAALLLVPLASGAAALELGQELPAGESVEALTAELEGLEPDELAELMKTLIAVGAEHAPEEVAVVIDPDGDEEGVAAAGDGEVTPVAAPAPAAPAPVPARAPAPASAAAASAPVNDGGAAALAAEEAASGSPALSGTRSSLRSESSLSFQALPPVVSAPFSFTTTPAPQTASAATSGGVLSMSAIEATLTSAAGAAVPAGAPGTLVATASGLLLLLGGAHLLHRRGALERVRRF